MSYTTPSDMDMCSQRALAEQTLQAAIAGNAKETESAFVHLAEIGGAQAMFDAVLSWANFAVEASTESMARVLYTCKLLLEEMSDPDEGATAEELEDTALFLSAVVRDDIEGAFFLWRSMPVERYAFVASIVLNLAVEAHSLNRPVGT